MRLASFILVLKVVVTVSSAAFAGPVVAPSAHAGPPLSSAVAAASLAGWTAAANSRTDTVELRDVSGALRRTITRAELAASLPWMNFNTDADGPCLLAFSDSGRLLFIGVCDTNASTDGQPADAILRYDTYLDQLSVFHRVELGGFNTSPRPMAVHFKGRLHVAQGTTVTSLVARMNDATGIVASTASFGIASNTTALAVDRAGNALHAASGTQLARASLGGSSLAFTPVGTLPAAARALAWSDHFGAVGQGGLYVAHAVPSGSAPETPLVTFIPAAMARGGGAWSPSTYLRGGTPPSGLAATCDGRLLLGLASGDCLLIRDDGDQRLDLAAWQADEHEQVVRFATSLISPDGEPPGWVIDADVVPNASRFHPATPDAAAWTVMVLLVDHAMTGDARSLDLVRTILTRYGGLAADGIRPSRNADGIYRHWISPTTGGVKPGWDPEFATMSTMKLVAAAARAMRHAPDDPVIRAAAHEIICGVSNWDGYFDSAGRMYLKGLAQGGRDGASASSGWHEGVIFAEQAGAYGSTLGPASATFWLTRAAWPAGSLVTGRGITSGAPGNAGASFISLYPLLLIDRYRVDDAWRTNVLNLRLNHAAWTDDNAPAAFTVFSAGTTKSIWGGYRADSLFDHPGDISTFPSLLAFGGLGPQATPEIAGAYHAYRLGMRQVFKGGASILYRRSNVDPAYRPDSAGIPDVVLGGLGLAELLQPGVVASTLTGPYPSCLCPSDWNGDGGVDGGDLTAFFADWEAGDADLNADGGTDGSDIGVFFGFWEAGC